MLPAKTFYMIRHGETEANAAQIMAGSMDSPLTAKGRAQAHTAQKIVKCLDIKPAAIYHSHLSRARDTAAIINEAINAPLFEDADLAEIHAGDLEGACYSLCQDLFRGWPQIPNAESGKEFFARVKRGKMKALSSDYAPVLIVCHGGVMRAFGEIHSISPPSRFQNAHLYEFSPNANNPIFPWNVFDFSLCEKTKKLLRNRSDIYDISLAEEIAS